MSVWLGMGVLNLTVEFEKRVCVCVVIQETALYTHSHDIIACHVICPH